MHVRWRSLGPFAVSLIVLSAIAILPSTPARASCFAVPERGSAEWWVGLQRHRYILWGVVDPTRYPIASRYGEPRFYLRANGYFKGHGPELVLVTTSSDALQPGLSRREREEVSRRFVEDLGGQQATVVTLNDQSGKDSVIQESCGDSTTGDAQTEELLPYLHQAFGDPVPPGGVRARQRQPSPRPASAPDWSGMYPWVLVLLAGAAAYVALVRRSRARRSP